jgi:GMP synthase (glutamine-hydrolysing)
VNVPRPPRVLVVQHEDECPPEFVGEWLVADGARLDVRRPYRGDALPDDLSGHDALIVLGGAMGAYDDDAHPWLTDTKALIRRAVADDVPMWGICLGHQLATVALGGTVAVNPSGRASGLTPVGRTDAAGDDPLLGGLGADALAVQWNNDVAVELPPGARLLASAPDGTPQAVRFADRAWGVQFHPEVGATVFALWAASAAKRTPDDPAPARALAEIESADERLRATWRPVVTAFGSVLAQRPADSRA